MVLVSASRPLPPPPLRLRSPRPPWEPTRGELGPGWKEDERDIPDAIGKPRWLPPCTKGARGLVIVPPRPEACWKRCSEVVPGGRVREPPNALPWPKLPMPPAPGRPERPEGARPAVPRTEGVRAESEPSPTVSLSLRSQSTDGFSLKTSWN